MGNDVNRMSVESIVQLLETRAGSKEIPAPVIAQAGAATRRAFAGRRLTVGLERRLEAYFSAVVRRRLVRSEGAGRAAARIVAAAVVTEMERSGRGPDAIWSELDRGWRGCIPEDLLEEYRVRLCA